jgi:hypothetical protein
MKHFSNPSYKSFAERIPEVLKTHCSVEHAIKQMTVSDVWTVLPLNVV